ncbi:MAG: hypothetical protein AAGK71_06100 [Pseudomonadota bacterium]
MSLADHVHPVRPDLNVTIYAASSLQKERATVKTPFWDTEKLVYRLSGDFLDVEISETDNLKREMKRQNGNMSWVEQTVNGRHLMDYVRNLKETDILDLWFSLVLRIDARLRHEKHRRQCMMNIQQDFGTDIWFTFCLLRREDDEVPLPNERYDVPTYRFFVG